ncbi:MAG: hypothetical protein IJW99_10815 [Clostridia bacterium]|nr:hypothetical protein [Clostridia bacterium]
MIHSDYSYIRRHFLNPQSEERLYAFLRLPCAPSEGLSEQRIREKITHYIQFCKRNHFGTVIPCFANATTSPEEFSLERFRLCYDLLLSLAQQAKIHVAFHLERALEKFILRMEEDCYEQEMHGKVLLVRSYPCEETETVHFTLQDGTHMCIVAFCEESRQIIDLRDAVTGDTLEWQVPRGNWCIHDYLCVYDEERAHANYLNYEASSLYIETAFSLFSDIFAKYGDTLNTLYYSDLCYRARNRRDWDDTFNRVFLERYGFGAETHYPALFHSYGNESHHLKALLHDCRSSMFRDGFIRAAYDFANAHKLTCFGNVIEPKTTACSWLSGDNIMNNTFAAGALLDKAYMYGTNSIKIAAGAAFNYDTKYVSCELFRDYHKKTRESLYKDAINAFARGVNIMLSHVPRMPAISEEEAAANRALPTPQYSHWEMNFSDFVSRMQTMLRGGAHVADIALLYPIYSIHNRTYLYDSPAEGFEYATTHPSLDYMSLINSISIYAGHDLTVLHPEIMDDRCIIEGSLLHMDNEFNDEYFSVIVLPGTEIIRLSNLEKLADFFDHGGKIISSGLLPTMALEYDTTGENDKRVKELVEHIFGKDATSPGILRSHLYNKNDAGGEAYVLYANMTAADGTSMVSGAQIQDVLTEFKLPYDVYLPFMPRVECPGAFNLNYPEFAHLGLHEHFPGSGMINYIHKRRGNIDIYYFSNTTEKAYTNYAMIRGKHVPEEWNPHTGQIRKLEYEYVTSRNLTYTRFLMDLTPSEARLIVCNGDFVKED